MQIGESNVINRTLNDGLLRVEGRFNTLKKTTNKFFKRAWARKELATDARRAQREWTKSAQRLGKNVRLRFVGFQTSFANTLGIASQSQVEAIAGDIKQVSRAVNRLVKSAASNGFGKPDPRA